jgi:hypothetical protein
MDLDPFPFSPESLHSREHCIRSQVYTRSRGKLAKKNVCRIDTARRDGHQALFGPPMTIHNTRPMRPRGTLASAGATCTAGPCPPAGAPSLARRLAGSDCRQSGP